MDVRVCRFDPDRRRVRNGGGCCVGGSEEMKHQATRDLFAYWNALRGERTAPERGEIDPTAIRNILADTFMLDVDVAQGFPFRLAGTRVNGLFNAEQKGSSFLDLWRAEERRNIAAVLMTVADGACPVVTGARATPNRQEDCALEALFLPLRHFGKTHARILGIITAGEQPAWLGLSPLGPMALRSLRIVDDARTAAAWAPNQIAVGAPLFAASAVSSAEQAFTSDALMIEDGVVRRDRPHLRVIQGGRDHPCHRP